MPVATGNGFAAGTQVPTRTRIVGGECEVRDADKVEADDRRLDSSVLSFLLSLTPIISKYGSSLRLLRDEDALSTHESRGKHEIKLS